MTRDELKSIIKECVNQIHEDIFAKEELTLEETVDLYGAIIEAYEGLLCEDTYELVEEGANLEYRDIFKKMDLDFSHAAKECKKCIKKGNKEGAIKANNDMKDILAKAEKEIKAIPSTAGSSLISFFTAWTVRCGRNLLLSLIPIAAFENQVKLMINSLRVIIDNSKDENTTSADYWNMYRTAILSDIKRLQDITKQNAAKIKKMD